MKRKGVNALFLERKGKYKKYTQISRALFIGTIVMMFLSIISNMIFGGNFERNLTKIGFILFFSGIIVEMIPAFLEKNKKQIIINLVLILCFAIAWLLLSQ